MDDEADDRKSTITRNHRFLFMETSSVSRFLKAGTLQPSHHISSASAWPAVSDLGVVSESDNFEHALEARPRRWVTDALWPASPFFQSQALAFLQWTVVLLQ